MFVPCPNCGFLVALAARRAGTSQHCPRCNALMSDDEAAPPPEARPAPDARTTANPAPSGHASASDDATEDMTPVAATPEPPAAASTRANASPSRPAVRASGPSFARVRIDPHATARRGPLLLAIAGLIALLGLQLLLSQRAELAAQARWRPLLGALCTVLRCDLPPWHQPEAYAMLDRGVKPRPDRPGVLHVNASFRNDARWAQAWPTLVLSLSDVDGRQVGLRAFAPAEYRAAHAASDVLEPGQSATVSFDVIEPAPHIVAFTFDFR